MKLRHILAVIALFGMGLLAGCFGGQPEEEASIDINVSEDIKEIETLQKQIKEQSSQLQKLETDLKVKKASKAAGSSEEVKKLEQQIAVQQNQIVQTSKKVTTVKAEKGKYVWSMYRAVPSHDFYNGFNISPPLSFKWKFKGGIGYRAAPVMDADNIYIGSLDQTFYAVEKGTGVAAWKTPCQGPISSSAALYGGKLYFGTETGMFYALSAATGQVLWSKKIGPAIMGSSPAVYNSVVVVGVADFDNGAEGRVIALNRSTGAVAWKYDTRLSVVSSPTIANGFVYVGCVNGVMYALDVDTGGLVWQYLASQTKGIASCAAENEGTLIFGADDKKVYAVNSMNGSAKWAYQAEGYITTGVIKAGMFFAGAKDGSIFALNAETGTPSWKITTEGKVMTAPLIVNNLLYVISGKDLLALDLKSGEKKWSESYETKIESSPIGEDGVIYFGDTASSLYAVESAAK